jgi:hypothetical protein
VCKTLLCIAVMALATLGITGTSALPAAAAGPCGTTATAPAYKHVASAATLTAAFRASLSTQA